MKEAKERQEDCIAFMKRCHTIIDDRHVINVKIVLYHKQWVKQQSELDKLINKKPVMEKSSSKEGGETIIRYQM